MPKLSAGLLMFRRREHKIDILLVHPGGPFFRNKDDGAWTIPKGEPNSPNENLFERAQIEFAEELGFRPKIDNVIELGTITQRGGKVVHAWAFESGLPNDFVLRSNTFPLEWPPRCGKMRDFPEIDRAEMFDVYLARTKINAAQIPFIDRLLEALEDRQSGFGD